MTKQIIYTLPDTDFLSTETDIPPDQLIPDQPIQPNQQQQSTSDRNRSDHSTQDAVTLNKRLAQTYTSVSLKPTTTSNNKQSTVIALPIVTANHASSTGKRPLSDDQRRDERTESFKRQRTSNSVNAEDHSSSVHKQTAGKEQTAQSISSMLLLAPLTKGQAKEEDLTKVIGRSCVQALRYGCAVGVVNATEWSKTIGTDGNGNTGNSKKNESLVPKPVVQLRYLDDQGRELTAKEAFKHLSHRFHGNGPTHKNKKGKNSKGKKAVGKRR